MRQGYTIPIAITLDYGNEADLRVAKRAAKELNLKHRVIDAHWYRELYPHALGLLSVVVASCFGSKMGVRGVVAGFTPSKSKDAPEHSEFFVVLMDRVWRSVLRTRRFMIFAPFAAWTAIQIGVVARDMNIDPRQYTVCNCGVCPECLLMRKLVEGYTNAPRYRDTFGWS